MFDETMNVVETRVRSVLSEQDFNEIDAAIKAFENRTSGELVISFQLISKGDPYRAGRKLFNKLGLYKTKLRNAVLVVIYIDSRKFAVLGDWGIDHKVSIDFWDSTVETMRTHFAADRLKEGLVEGIKILGGELVHYFPYDPDDVDELSDDLHFGDDE